MTSVAVRHESFGDIAALQLVTAPHPRLPSQHVRIEVAYAGLNPIDWQIVESRELAAQFGVAVPSGFGNDFSGRVVEVGDDVTRWRIGERVFGGARGAAVASHLVLHENHPRLHRTPDAVDDMTAGVLDVAGRTAAAIIDALTPTPGDTVLVSAATGGVGVVLTQLLTAAGARVIGSGSAASADAIAKLGAVPVTYGPDLGRDVEATGLGPVTAAVDLFDDTTARVALALGVPAARIVTIESESPPPGVRAVNGSDASRGAVLDLAERIAAGGLRVPIDSVFPLERFMDGVRRQRGRHARGKVVIEIHPEARSSAR